MKASIWYLLAVLVLPSCGQDTASKEVEARVSAAITQKLGDQHPTVLQVHHWYQSEVPNLIKLNPKTESIYQAHAALLEEQAKQVPVLTKNPLLQPGEAEAVAGVYERAIAASTDRVTELTQLAGAETAMSETEQLQYVSEIAEKQQQLLATTKHYGERKAATLTRRAQQEVTRQRNQIMWGHE